MSGAAAPSDYLFGPFRFDAAHGALFRDGAPVRVGARALAILAALLERPGELYDKRELMALAWPGRVIAEGNVKVTVAALRQALGDSGPAYRYVISVSGRGYRFAAPVRRSGEAPPAAPNRTLGREETMAALWRQLIQRRFVTVAGPGGIGKTTVAMALAAHARGQHGLETCFVDLAPLPDPCFVAGTVASALGLGIPSHDVMPALVAALRGRRLLLVLDSCEHALDAAAELAERIVGAAPGVLLLTTSREPLRTAGESVHRLAPLGYPSAGARLDAQQALRYPAIALFAERAAESVQGYELLDADVPAVAEICRRLEGIALAIELAATRVDAFGARELARRLDDRFRLLERGRRGAQARHRTLTAALDWSYAFLPPQEQSLLRAVSVFAGGFTLDGAAALCGGSEADALAIMDAVAGLVAKSLLAPDYGASGMHYRLLDTTRAYAQEKLDECGETAKVRLRHAVLQRAILERAAVEWEARPSADWLLDHGRRIDDLRLALAWAASADGDRAIAIALTVAAVPLWMHLSLLDECRRAIEAALRMGEAGDAPAPRERMKLYAGRAAAALYADGPLAETADAWACALDLAERLGDGEYRLRALWGLAVHRSYAGEHRAALELAERFRLLAGERADRAAHVSADRMVATALHYLGDQRGARRRLETMLARYVAPVHRSHIARFQLDQRPAALGTLANVLWIQGLPEAALRAAQAALEGARASGHALSLLNALVHAACPICLYIGDDDEAGRLLDELSGQLERHALTVWHALARCLRGVLLARRGEAEGLRLLTGALDALRQAGFRLRFPAYLGMLATALAANGRREEALATVCEALDGCAANGERWCLPELLRIKGDLLALDDAVRAEGVYRQAAILAREQGALSWALRIACSQAVLLGHQGRGREGRERLAVVYAQFGEGLATADLRRARALLESPDGQP